MDTARVSIAQVLALGVPLTWNDAAAVAQAVTYLSDTNSLLNDAPSIVRIDTCFITTDGEVELPETGADAPKDGVLTLLRQMLAGRDAPADLLHIATGDDPGGLTALLTRIEISNGRTLIAAVARATLARAAAPTLPSAQLFSRRTQQPRPAPPPEPVPPLAPVSVVAPAPAVASDPVIAPRSAAPPWPPPSYETPVRAATAPTVDAPRPQSPMARIDVTSPPPLVAVERPSHLLRLVTPAAPARQRPRVELRRRSSLAIVAAAVSALAVTGAWLVIRMLDERPASVAEIPPIAAWPLPGGIAGFAGAVQPSPATSVAAPSAPPASRTDPPPAASATFAFGTPPLFAVEAPRSNVPPPPAPAVPVAPVDTPAAAVAAPVATTPLDSGASPRGIEGARNELAAADGDGTAAADDAAALFSGDDRDVSPPVLRTASLPSAVRTPGSQAPSTWPYLTLVVGPTGAVEQVLLRAPTPRPGESLYRHQMLLAAAKAWRFSPATRNGRPVRYAMRVPLEP